MSIIFVRDSTNEQQDRINIQSVYTWLNSDTLITNDVYFDNAYI